jgi:DnaJ-class molecular chaperone
MSDMVECPQCEGWGRCEYERAVPASFSNSYGYLEDFWDDCEVCDGLGQIEEELEEEDEE